MRVANHFVHVSTKEGFGLVVTEAMWQGAPVIGSRVGGIVKQVIEGKTGFQVEPMDVDAIAGNMKKILLNGEMRNKLSETAITHVQQNFLLPVLVRNYIMMMRYFLKIDKNPPFFMCSSCQ
jgi:trehalose synthase